MWPPSSEEIFPACITVAIAFQRTSERILDKIASEGRLHTLDDLLGYLQDKLQGRTSA